MSQSCNFMLGTPTPPKKRCLGKEMNKSRNNVATKVHFEIYKQNFWVRRFDFQFKIWQLYKRSNTINFSNLYRPKPQIFSFSRFQGSIKGIFFFPLASEVQTCQYTYHNVTPFPCLALDTFDVCVAFCPTLYWQIKRKLSQEFLTFGRRFTVGSFL